MADNQQIVVRNATVDEFPPYTPAELVEFSEAARERERLVIELGDGADQIRKMQITHLKWFAEDPRRVQVLGYRDIFQWAMVPEITKAIWGADAAPGTTRERFVRTLRLQISLPEINVFSDIPRSFHSDGTFAEIESAVKELPELPDDDVAEGGEKDEGPNAEELEQARLEREAGVNRLKDKIENEKTKTWKKRREEKNKQRASLFSFAAGDGILRYQGTPVIKLVPEAGEVGAELLHLILRPSVRFIIDADLIKAWIGDELVIVGSVLNANEQLTNVIVDALRAERKTT